MAHLYRVNCRIGSPDPILVCFSHPRKLGNHSKSTLNSNELVSQVAGKESCRNSPLKISKWMSSCFGPLIQSCLPWVKPSKKSVKVNNGRNMDNGRKKHLRYMPDKVAIQSVSLASPEWIVDF